MALCLQLSVTLEEEEQASGPSCVVQGGWIESGCGAGRSETPSGLVSRGVAVAHFGKGRAGVGGGCRQNCPAVLETTGPPTTVFTRLEC